MQRDSLTGTQLGDLSAGDLTSRMTRLARENSPAGRLARRQLRERKRLEDRGHRHAPSRKRSPGTRARPL